MEQGPGIRPWGGVGLSGTLPGFGWWDFGDGGCLGDIEAGGGW